MYIVPLYSERLSLEPCSELDLGFIHEKKLKSFRKNFAFYVFIVFNLSIKIYNQFLHFCFFCLQSILTGYELRKNLVLRRIPG